jgi:cation diffusion facilitator CzcD-associated flavoprotein CzcO
MKRIIRATQRKWLSEAYIDEHFTPPYNPWDQRLCAVPDADLFEVLRKGRASVVTDRIETFTETGIRLAGGRELEADIIVTATGLDLLALGGIELSVEGEPVDMASTLVYKSMMLSDVPNFAFAVGYTNSSWTLKVDLVCEHMCRLMTYMDQRGWDAVVPHNDDPTVETRPLLDFGAGYVLRAVDQFPRQGSKGPWQVAMSYKADRRNLLEAPVQDAALRFSARQPAATPALAASA